MAQHCVTMRYHLEEDSWWAESDDAPGYSAVAATLADLRALVRVGVAFHLDVEPDGVVILEPGMSSAEVVYTLSVPVVPPPAVQIVKQIVSTASMASMKRRTLRSLPPVAAGLCP